MGTRDERTAATRWQGTDEQGAPGNGTRPDPEWVRGTCPRCGGELVSKSYHVAGRGYLILWECWNSLVREPSCDYRHVL